MPKVVSNIQRLANRRNAQNSTGPATPEGRAKSARNAIKHGLLPTHVVVSTGDGAESLVGGQQAPRPTPLPPEPPKPLQTSTDQPQ